MLSTTSCSILQKTETKKLRLKPMLSSRCKIYLAPDYVDSQNIRFSSSKPTLTLFLYSFMNSEPTLILRKVSLDTLTVTLYHL